MAEPPVTRMEAFLDAWSASLLELLSQLAPGAWSFAGLSAVEQHSPLAVFRIGLQRGLQGCCRIALGRKDADVLLHLFTGEESAIGEALDSLQSEALIELIRQWAGLAASHLKTVFGEVALEVNQESTLAPGSSAARLLRVSSGERSIAVRMEMDPELLARLDRRQSRRAQPVPGAGAGSLDKLLREGNLDLLLDVELGVTLRFGSRRAPLREVLELAPGAVLELNREIQEPVDLLLNDRVIARGDVVVVDGNYGLHITDVISPEQRLRTV